MRPGAIVLWESGGQRVHGILPIWVMAEGEVGCKQDSWEACISAKAGSPSKNLSQPTSDGLASSKVCHSFRVLQIANSSELEREVGDRSRGSHSTHQRERRWIMVPFLPANRLDGTWYGGGGRQVHHAPRALNSVAGCATPSHNCWRSCKFHLWTGQSVRESAPRVMPTLQGQWPRRMRTRDGRVRPTSTDRLGVNTFGLQVLSCWLLVASIWILNSQRKSKHRHPDTRCEEASE